jgi:hypothetical protein
MTVPLEPHHMTCEELTELDQHLQSRLTGRIQLRPYLQRRTIP